MENPITVGHPFYFPTQVILLDDDPDFLDGVSLMLDKSLSFKLFQSASQALKYVNSAHKQLQLLQRCYTSYKTGPSDSDALTHIDINKIHHEVLNGSRFQTASTIVVDYSMPEMNGLDFLMAVENPFIKKVLLTGQADMELAIKAFNKQLIDQFIDKHDPKLRLKLNNTISHFQDQYFRSSFKLLTDPIIANNHDGFLVDTAFQTFFSKLRLKLDCVEYYLIDTPHSGFLMVDSKGRCYCLLIYTAASLHAHYQALLAMQAPAELAEQVKDARLIPGFKQQDDSPVRLDDIVKNWQQYYHPAIQVEGSNSFFAAIIDGKHLEAIQDKQLIPYSSFLEANTMSNETLH